MTIHCSDNFFQKSLQVPSAGAPVPLFELQPELLAAAAAAVAAAAAAVAASAVAAAVAAAVAVAVKFISWLFGKLK